MLKIKQKHLGIGLVLFGILLVILLGVVKLEYDNQAGFLCEVIADNPDIDMGQCPAHQSNTSWYLSMSLGLAFLVMGSGTYLAISPEPKKESKPNFKKIDISRLHEDEKTVYNMLKEKEGSMYQSDLIKHTEFSKVKMTRVLDRLEHKKILERKRRGMTNIVVLK